MTKADDSQLDNAVLADRAAELLSILDARSKDIVERRYGIESGSVETLDSIGKEYGITRERVRQIEAQAKRLLARRHEVLSDVAESLHRVFAAHGGVLTDEYLMAIISDDSQTPPHLTLVLFYLDVLPPYQRLTRATHFGPHWVHPDVATAQAEPVVETAEGILREHKAPMSEKELLERIREDLDVTANEVPDEHVYALLTASKQLKRTVFGEWGLSDWVETSPRGVGDKAYIVLRRHGQPAHFREITELINEVEFDHKRAHEQTVHNELIKDDRFVLVGRGLYGLTDWGYIPGTVADVLEAILTEASQPMTREELLERVLEQRMVKKTTVLLGLQNEKRFRKVPGDKYTLKLKA